MFQSMRKVEQIWKEIFLYFGGGGDKAQEIFINTNLNTLEQQPLKNS